MSRKKRANRNRAYRKNRLYYCAKCQYYIWRDDTGTLKRSMWNQSPSVTPVGRTCNDCNV